MSLHHDRIRLASAILTSRHQSRESLAEIHSNGMKTGCTSAVLAFYGISKKTFKFCQTTQDVIRLLNRDGLTAENVGRRKETKKVVGKSIKNLNKYVFAPGYYLISTWNHVLLIHLSDESKLTYSVDTNPQENDLRRIESIHKIKTKKYATK